MNCVNVVHNPQNTALESDLHSGALGEHLWHFPKVAGGKSDPNGTELKNIKFEMKEAF